jgi:nanoRNase/pAp phosphatase (c-di-AMP/oligoRNAs hydrolase)
MALTPEQQAFEHISRATRILIVTKEHATNDAIASVVSCSLLVNAMGKQADVVVPGLDPKQIPAFLPSKDRLSSDIGAMRTLDIALDVKDVPLRELSYDVKDGVLHISLIPKRGEWTPKHVSFKHGSDRYDLVIALDTPDMHSLGELAKTHADFLYRTPIINIDCSPTNEQWGQINLVQLTAVSTTEILFELLETWNRSLLNADLATALLAGMIAKTNSFRTPNVTPKTLTIASRLIAAGARREEIVHGLWRTRSVGTLKLWGRLLSRLKQDETRGLVWSTLTRHDMLETGATSDVLPDVTNELIAYVPDAKVIVYVFETDDGKARVSIQTSAPYSAADLARPFGGTGTRAHALVDLTEQLPLVEATKHVIDRLRSTIDELKRP